MGSTAFWMPLPLSPHSLGWNRLSDVGVQPIVQALANHPTLKKIWYVPASSFLLLILSSCSTTRASPMAAAQLWLICYAQCPPWRPSSESGLGKIHPPRLIISQPGWYQHH